MHITQPDIEAYIAQRTNHLLPELEDLARETYLKVLLPNMISSKEQGVFLYQFVTALNPQKALELGTFTGYSAICIAMGLAENAILTTLDVNEEIAHIPRRYFDKLNLSKKINYIILDALSYIKTIEDNSLDFVFIDADKRNYPNYFIQLKSKLKSGGYLLVDNVLWHGRILDAEPTKDTVAIREMTDLIYSDKDFITNIIPIRDGILVARKS